MGKFTDYEASYVTPQLTLLGKLNAILKYLRNSGFDKYPLQRQLYLHKISDGYRSMTIVSDVKTSFTQTFNEETMHEYYQKVFINSSVNHTLQFRLAYTGSVYKFVIYNSALSQESNITSDVVEEL